MKSTSNDSSLGSRVTGELPSGALIAFPSDTLRLFCRHCSLPSLLSLRATCKTLNTTLLGFLTSDSLIKRNIQIEGSAHIFGSKKKLWLFLKYQYLAQALTPEGFKTCLAEPPRIPEGIKESLITDLDVASTLVLKGKQEALAKLPISPDTAYQYTLLALANVTETQSYAYDLREAAATLFLYIVTTLTAPETTRSGALFSLRTSILLFNQNNGHSQNLATAIAIKTCKSIFSPNICAKTRIDLFCCTLRLCTLNIISHEFESQIYNLLKDFILLENLELSLRKTCITHLTAHMYYVIQKPETHRLLWDLIENIIRNKNVNPSVRKHTVRRLSSHFAYSSPDPLLTPLIKKLFTELIHDHDERFKIRLHALHYFERDYVHNASPESIQLILGILHNNKLNPIIRTQALFSIFYFSIFKKHQPIAIKYLLQVAQNPEISIPIRKDAAVYYLWARISKRPTLKRFTSIIQHLSNLSLPPSPRINLLSTALKELKCFTPYYHQTTQYQRIIKELESTIAKLKGD